MELLLKHFSSTTTDRNQQHITFPTFKRLFEELEKLGYPPLRILETGTCNYGTQSTLLFDQYVTKYGGKLITVDIDKQVGERIKSLVSSNTTISTGDSVGFIKSFAEKNPNLKFDLIYLDSMDIEWNNYEASAQHGLKEFEAIKPLLKSGSFILIDDTPVSDEYLKDWGYTDYRSGKKVPGKGMYVVDLLKDKLIEHKYQALFKY